MLFRKARSKPSYRYVWEFFKIFVLLQRESEMYIKIHEIQLGTVFNYSHQNSVNRNNIRWTEWYLEILEIIICTWYTDHSVAARVYIWWSCATIWTICTLYFSWVVFCLMTEDFENNFSTSVQYCVYNECVTIDGLTSLFVGRSIRLCWFL